MKAKLLKPSKRGLTFSLPANETYYPGQHYIYEIYKNKIIIRLAQKGMTISRKKSGNEYKALFDIRKKEVRDTVSRCSYMEMDVQTEQIVIRCIKKEQAQSKVISIERVLEEFCISNQVLSAAAGIEGQMDLFDYFGKETLNESSYGVVHSAEPSITGIRTLLRISCCADYRRYSRPDPIDITVEIPWYGNSPG